MAIDIGGTHVKLRVSNRPEIRVFDSTESMTPAEMMREVWKTTDGWTFDRVSLGYPGLVIDGRIVAEPVNLGPGWTRFNFKAAFKRPTLVVNDAVMQAIGSYQGGRLLFLGFGTALGAVAILDSSVHALELAYLPFNKHASVQKSVGDEALRRLGRARWSANALQVVNHLSSLLDVQSVVLGGGNARKIKRLPKNATLAEDDAAFFGGFKIWRQHSFRPI